MTRPARHRSPSPSPPRAALALVLAVILAAVPGAAAASGASRPTLPVIERQVMCVTCKIPLNVAQSQQADRERVFIQGLIDQGQSETQIKNALVAQYGPSVLGLPATHGFDLVAYLVPLAVVLALAGLLAVLLPRWRRSRRSEDGAGSAAETLDADDAARLDADLARFK